MSPEAAAFLVGIVADDFPEDIVMFEDEPEPQPVPPQLQPFQAPQPTMNGDGRQAEERALRKWLKKRDNPDPARFEVYHLTPQERDAIAWQVKGATTSTASMDDVDAALHAFQIWADEHDPEMATVLNLEVAT